MCQELACSVGRQDQDRGRCGAAVSTEVIQEFPSVPGVLFVWMIDEKQMKQGIHPVWTQGPRSMLEFSSWWLISTVNRANERTMAHNFLSKDYTGGHNITKVDSILKDRCVGWGQEAQASTTVQHRYSCGGLCNHLLHQNFTSYG